MLEGSVRRAGIRLRVAAQLIDAQTGTHLWAHNFDGNVESIFDAQDQITEGVAVVVEPHIRGAEIERSRRKRPESFDAYDLYLQAMAKLQTRRQDENAEAHGMLIRSLAIDPDFAPALAKAAWALEVRFGLGWPALTNDDRAGCLEHCARALARADGDCQRSGQLCHVADDRARIRARPTGHRQCHGGQSQQLRGADQRRHRQAALRKP